MVCDAYFYSSKYIEFIMGQAISFIFIKDYLRSNLNYNRFKNVEEPFKDTNQEGEDPVGLKPSSWDRNNTFQRRFDDWKLI